MAGSKPKGGLVARRRDCNRDPLGDALITLDSLSDLVIAALSSDPSPRYGGYRPIHVHYERPQHWSKLTQVSFTTQTPSFGISMRTMMIRRNMSAKGCGSAMLSLAFSSFLLLAAIAFSVLLLLRALLRYDFLSLPFTMMWRPNRSDRYGVKWSLHQTAK